ncbi:MAG: DMT family transporter [Flavobacteriales bacterium]|nr:DMT family transporter [Flavobacteriales bacterium]
MQSRRNALILLHLTVFIWGFTGILGKLIQEHQSTMPLVYTRTLIAMVGLALGALWLRRSLSPATKDLKHYLLTSLIITAHWITFYGAIEISTASIAVACLSTSTVFTALLEPFWFKRKIRVYEVVLGLIVVAALLLIFGLESGYREGIIVGTLSALFSAWFNIINAVLIKRGDALRIGFYEMTGAALCMAIYLFSTNALPPPLWKLPPMTIVWHLLLGLVCTSFAFVAGIVVMRQLSPFTVVLTVNLEPIYTIVIALLIWGSEEKLRTGSYLGIALILICLFVNGWFQRKRDQSEVIEPAPLTQG